MKWVWCSGGSTEVGPRSGPSKLFGFQFDNPFEWLRKGNGPHTEVILAGEFLRRSDRYGARSQTASARSKRKQNRTVFRLLSDISKGFCNSLRIDGATADWWLSVFRKRIHKW